MLTVIIALATLACSTLNSFGHEVWIEELEGKMVVRFAEYGEDYEKSPGHLDGLNVTGAWSVGEDGKPAAFPIEKKADHVLLVGATPGKSFQAEAGYAVMKRGEGPARKPFFYARWYEPSAGAAKPALLFDIVPTGKEGEVQVFFRGKPQAGAKLTVVAPDHKEEELTADAEGRAKFTPQKGSTLLYGKHQREDTPGFSEGLEYASVSHNCSLLWKQP